MGREARRHKVPRMAPPLGTDRELWITAREEAAHAFAAVMCANTTFDSISVVPEGTSLGRILRVLGPEQEVAVVMLCGALVTDVKALEYGRMPKMDEDDARGVLLLNHVERQAALRAALDFLRQPNADIMIDKLAAALLRQQSLTHKEVLEIVLAEASAFKTQKEGGL